MYISVYWLFCYSVLTSIQICTAASTYIHTSLLRGLVKHPYCDSSRPWPTPKKSKTIHESSSHQQISMTVLVFSLFFSPRKALQIFPHPTRVMPLIHQHPFTPASFLLLPAVPCKAQLMQPADLSAWTSLHTYHLHVGGFCQNSMQTLLGNDK